MRTAKEAAIKRREFLALLNGAAVAWPLGAGAQQAVKVPRIGYLSTTLAANTHLREAFEQGLRDLGYVEGRSLLIEYRSADGDVERLPTLAAELVALKVDLILAPSTVAAVAARQVSTSVPIVSVAVTSGVVSSLARPDGNITGLAFFSPELIGKCLEVLHEAVPGVDRVAALWEWDRQSEGTEKDMLKHAEAAGQALGLRILSIETRGPADSDTAFSEMRRARAGALTVLPSNLFLTELRRLAQMAAKNRLPAVYPAREFVDAGGLLSYGTIVAERFRRAAAYVDKILKGVKPGDLPIEQPTKFELVINIKTAKALGLTIPPALLARADDVIE